MARHGSDESQGRPRYLSISQERKQDERSPQLYRRQSSMAVCGFALKWWHDHVDKGVKSLCSVLLEMFFH